ncbi:MAG: hypothetical protein ACPG67_02025, partial [Candidatus Puniceispirillaceae bacterium]
MSAQPLARAFRQIGGMTAVSRVLGFVRDVVFAALLGAGPAADASNLSEEELDANEPAEDLLT